MFEPGKNLYFPQRSLAIGLMLERRDFFDSHLCLRHIIVSGSETNINYSHYNLSKGPGSNMLTYVCTMETTKPDHKIINYIVQKYKQRQIRNYLLV